jgi:hypothetical protein
MSDAKQVRLHAIDRYHAGERDQCTKAQAEEQVVSCLSRRNWSDFAGKRSDEI